LLGGGVSAIGRSGADPTAHAPTTKQDPILLEGTVRTNLDPFEQYSDAAVAAAIDRVRRGVGALWSPFLFNPLI
jgi:hypothetical protein